MTLIFRHTFESTIKIQISEIQTNEIQINQTHINQLAQIQSIKFIQIQIGESQIHQILIVMDQIQMLTKFKCWPNSNIGQTQIDQIPIDEIQIKIQALSQVQSANG